jgi:hypothetical protein
MINHPVLALAAVALATGLVACGGDGPSGVRVSVDGTYVLSTVNGQPLPFATDSTTTQRIQVLSGQKIVTSIGDGSLDLQSTEVDRTTNQPGPTVTLDTVRQSENVAFDGTNFATARYAGTIRGDTMMIYIGDLAYDYIRAR